MASVLLFALKGLLDQVPDVIRSAGEVRAEWDRFKKRGAETPQQDEQLPPLVPPATIQEPPAAA